MKEPGQLAAEASGLHWPKLPEAAKQRFRRIEAAIRADERERCAKVAERPEWIGCARCGNVLNEWFTYDCPEHAKWLETDRAKKMMLLDGAYVAERYFEKYVCGNFDRLDHEKVGPAIAAAIRAGEKP